MVLHGIVLKKGWIFDLKLIGNGVEYMKRIKWGKEFEEFLVRNNMYSQVITTIFSRNRSFDEYTKSRYHLSYIYDLRYILAPDIINWDLFWELDSLWVEVCEVIEEHESI